MVERFPPATTSVTATMIRRSPHTSRMVSVSPKTVMPKNIAVTGSSTPNMAVAVEPTYCMANVVHTNDTVVVNNDNAKILNHRYQ